MHLNYNDRLRVVAFTQQSLHGAFSQQNAEPLGTLDVIGKDRRYFVIFNSPTVATRMDHVQGKVKSLGAGPHCKKVFFFFLF